MKNNLNTNYIIVVDYDENNCLLEDQYLLGWDNKSDWFDCDTYGDEIITPSGRVKKNHIGFIDIDKWVSVYVNDGNSLNELFDTCRGGNEEGYDCTVCKIEKDSDGDLIVVPVHTLTYVGVIVDEGEVIESFITSDDTEREEKSTELLTTFNTCNYENGYIKICVLEDYPNLKHRLKKLEDNLIEILDDEGVSLYSKWSYEEGVNGTVEDIRYWMEQTSKQIYCDFDSDGIDNYR